MARAIAKAQWNRQGPIGFGRCACEVTTSERNGRAMEGRLTLHDQRARPFTERERAPDFGASKESLSEIVSTPGELLHRGVEQLERRQQREQVAPVKHHEEA